jgi:hypothetical protein
VFETNIDVGPSADPIIPIAADSAISNPKAIAINIVRKIPNCAAAPKNIINGFLNIGVKSI